MDIQLIIKGKLPSLNEYIKRVNNNRFGGNNFKKETELNIRLQVLRQIREKGIVEHLPLKKQANFEFTYVEVNKKRDKDNIASSKKFLFDALVQSGVIQDDGWRWVGSFKEDFIIGDENMVIIKIKEKEN